MNIEIRSSLNDDLPAILAVARDAFGAAEGEEIARLISDLAADASAEPVLSLVANVEGRIIGHILFSEAKLGGVGAEVSARLLAPLAVQPDFQSMGVGRRLILEGLDRLKRNGVDLVFVLGHPGYYPRFGFVEAGTCGLEAPYPILPKNAGAWMVYALQPDLIGRVSGRVICADSLAEPRYWQE